MNNNFQSTNLKELLEVIESGSRPAGGVNSIGEIPSLGGENIMVGGGIIFYPVKKISKEFFSQMNKGHLIDYDVLINKDGANTGKVGLYKFSPYDNAAVNEHLFILRGKKNKINNSFLYYLLLSDYGQEKIKAKVAGSAQPGLNTQFVNNFKVCIPSNIKEQKKIAEILTSVDRVIEQTEKEIAKLKDLRFAFAENKLNPRKWGTIQLSTILSNAQNSMRGGPFGSKFRKYEWGRRGTPYLGIDNIHKEYFKKDFKRFVSSKKLPELESYRTFPFDVVVTIMGTIGRCCIIPDDGSSYVSSKHLRTMTIDRNKYNVNLLCFQLNYSSWVWKQYADG